MNARNTQKPRTIAKRLEEDGWTGKPGKGDHQVFRKPQHNPIVVDMGAKEIPVGTLRSIYRAAGWEW